MSKVKRALSKVLNWSVQTESQRNFYQKQTRDLEWEYIKPEIKSGKFLDIGCGKGYTTFKAFRDLGCESYGVDPDNNLVGVVFDKEIDYSKITITKGYAENCPFENEFFDTLFCSHVIEHVENIGAVLKEMKRIIKPDGKIIIGVPTNHMAFINLISAYLFTTHTKLLGWFFYKKWNIKRPSLKQIFLPPSHSHEGRSVFFDMCFYSDKNWTKLLETELHIEKRIYPALYPYPDFIQFFPSTHFSRFSSTIFYVCEVRTKQPRHY